jgi:pimeloyl-ACP methyl ester carboxylesterase
LPNVNGEQFIAAYFCIMFSLVKHPIFLIMLFALLYACKSIDDQGVLVPPTVNEDKNLPSVSIEVAGRTRLVHVRTFGNSTSPVLFLIHGSYSDSRPYRNICQALADKYFVVAWDQRGCGLSERITESEFTLPSTIEEVKAMKNKYAPNQNITLIGQSWGGGVAAAFTGAYPNDVDQCILIEPIPLTGNDMLQLYQTIIQFTYTNQSWNELARHGEAISPRNHEQIDYRAHMILKSTMTRGYHCDGNNPPEWNVHRVGAFVEYVRNKRLGNPVTGFTYDFTKGLEQFNDSVLVLGGSCSSLGYKVQEKYTKPHFKNAHVVEIQNAGHRMNIERFDAVMEAIKNYLKEY